MRDERVPIEERLRWTDTGIDPDRVLDGTVYAVIDIAPDALNGIFWLAGNPNRANTVENWAAGEPFLTSFPIDRSATWQRRHQALRLALWDHPGETLTALPPAFRQVSLALAQQFAPHLAPNDLERGKRITNCLLLVFILRKAVTSLADVLEEALSKLDLSGGRVFVGTTSQGISFPIVVADAAVFAKNPGPGAAPWAGGLLLRGTPRTYDHTELGAQRLRESRAKAPHLLNEIKESNLGMTLPSMRESDLVAFIERYWVGDLRRLEGELSQVTKRAISRYAEGRKITYEEALQPRHLRRLQFEPLDIEKLGALYDEQNQIFAVRALLRQRLAELHELNGRFVSAEFARNQDLIYWFLRDSTYLSRLRTRLQRLMTDKGWANDPNTLVDFLPRDHFDFPPPTLFRQTSTLPN